MLLRDHPLMTYQNSRSWPPVWLYRGGFDNTHPRGEVGVLTTVYLSVVKPSTSCSLILEHAGAEYMGTEFLKVFPDQSILGPLSGPASTTAKPAYQSIPA
jgi:hypothetical protein